MLNVSVSPVLARERHAHVEEKPELVEERERADRASVNAAGLADAADLADAAGLADAGKL